MPRIATLHSFALRQLLRNSRLITALPQPLRIADDWEERHIILEDLKSLLGLDRIERARDLLNALSADWQTLTADEGDWEKRFPDPAFPARIADSLRQAVPLLHRSKAKFFKLRSQYVWQPPVITLSSAPEI